MENHINKKLSPQYRLWRAILWCMALAALVPEFIAPVIAFVTVILYFDVLKTKKRLPKLSMTGILFLAVVVWMFIGVTYTSNAFLGLSVSVLWLLAYCVYLYTADSVNSLEKVEKIILAVSIAGGIAGFIGVMEIFLMHYGGCVSESLRTMFNPFYRVLNDLFAKLSTCDILPEFIRNSLPRTTFNTISLRASSTFTNPLIYAYFLILVFPFAVYGLFHSTLKNVKWISFSCIVLIIGGIASSYSRGPYLAMVLAVIILMFYSRKTAYKMLGLSFAAVVLLIMVAPGVFERLLSIGSTTDTSINLRYSIWRAALDTIKEHPFFGLGTSVENMRHILNNVYGINQPHAHNLFLEILVEDGIIGFSIFISALLYSGYRIFSLCTLSKRGRALGLTFLSGFVGFMACGMLDYVLYAPKIVIYFMFYIGLSEAAFRVCKAEAKKKKAEDYIDI